MAATLHFAVLATALRRSPLAIATVHHDGADRSPRERPETDATSPEVPLRVSGRDEA